MLRSVLLAILAATAVACSDGPRRLAEPSGPTFRLNPDRWVESTAVAQAPRQ